MELVIGGRAQGKLETVLKKYGEDACVVFDGALPDEAQAEEIRAQGRLAVVDHFHSWVRERLLRGGEPEAEIAAYLARSPETVIISDETGGGIVPADAFERACRERTGRLLTRLAEQADEVVRVICGIGQRLK